MIRPSGPGSWLSMTACRLLTGHRRSLCAHAHALRHDHPLARRWCAILPAHCARAHVYWIGD